MKPNVLYCSFCGKSEHEVFLLIAGPKVCVCDECIALCSEIIAEKRAAATLKKAYGPAVEIYQGGCRND